MFVDEETLRRSERRGVSVPARLAGPKPLTPAQLGTRRSNLSFAGAQPSPAEYERFVGDNDLVDEFYLERALVAARPVCRLIVRTQSGRELGYATGFLVSPRLLITNWHVFRTRDEAANAVAEFDFKLDIRGNPLPSYRFALRPDRFYHSNQDLDYALVAVDPVSMDDQTTELSSFGYHRLLGEPGKIWEGEWITIIQHPGGQRRQFSIRENQLTKKLEEYLWYVSDTAQGSSGAPAFNDSFQVVALHHMGRAKKEGGRYVLKDKRTVASLDGIDDSEVVWEANEGLRVSVLCADMASALPSGDEYVSELFEAMNGGDVMSKAVGGAVNVVHPEAIAVRADGSPNGIVVPLQLHVALSYGAPASAVAVAMPVAGAGKEPDGPGNDRDQVHA